MTLVPDQLRHLAERLPDEVAFSVAAASPVGGDLTLGEWHAASSRFARGLLGLGVAPGERVALLLDPDDALRFVVAYAGVHKAGGVAVPVNVRLSTAEIVGILRHCEAAAAVVTGRLTAAVLDGRAQCPALRTVVTCAAAGEHQDAMQWEAVPAGSAEDIQVPREPDDLAEILYTSGTTGSPKGVAVRHCNYSLMLLTDPAWTGAPWLHASPMFTFAGLTFVYQPMRLGMRTLYQPRFDASAWLKLVANERPTAAFLVPAMVELLLTYPDVATADLSSLTLVSIGAAPAAPATLLRFQELIPDATVTNSYSMTEAGTAYFTLPKGELARRPGSVGKPMPPAEVRVVDDAGVPVGSGVVGAIEVKPAGRVREYYRDTEASAAVFGPDGWLRTGDLGRCDEDGFLYVVGRAKDMIIRGGYNVYASDVEAALYEHPAVREAAVVGEPHPVLGEDIAAYVVLHEPVSAEELTAHCAARLADYKVPRRFEFRDELPRNATGKVLKRDLICPARG